MATDSHLETLLAHAGLQPDPGTGALAPPLHLSTTYERDADLSYPRGYIYSREGNPTRQTLETTLAGLESGAAAFAFSSGLAACHALLQALPRPAHILIPNDVYHGFRQLVLDLQEQTGLTFSAIDMQNISLVRDAIHADTRLIWIETPSNPQLQITDIRAVADIGRSRGVTVAVDGTWTTPVIQRPFELGADVVVHSLTKYMAGHSDVLGGAVILNDASDLLHGVSAVQRHGGAVLDPFSCWLTLRGLRSLAVRLNAQAQTALAIATFLDGHERIDRVHYPWLESHAEHEIARQQMDSGGAMLSFEVVGGKRAAVKAAASLSVFRRATSLGGTESLVEHRASVEGPHSPTPQSLLRLSIGLEHVDDLIADLENALVSPV